MTMYKRMDEMDINKIYAGERKAKQDMDWAECTLDWQIFDDWMLATYRNSCNPTSDFMVGYHSVMQKEMELAGFWDQEDDYV